MDYIESILSVLQVGKDNAIHLDEIAERLHVSTTTAKKHIKKLRQIHNKPICSSCYGYWIAESREELESNSNSLRNRAISSFKCAKGMRHNLNSIQGQISLNYDDTEPKEKQKGANNEE